MTYLLIFLMVFLAGCGSDYTRDGVTVVSYCLLGGVYIDDTETSHKMHYPPSNQCVTEPIKMP